MKPPLRNNAPDDFQTPPIALKPLYPYIKKDWVIWECASGNGNLVKALKSKGYKVISSDIKNGQDFLTYEPKHYDCIITNPPFSLKQAFLERAYQLNKPFCFLLPLTTLETKKRQQLFKEHGTQIILFDKRINFETPTGKDSSSWFASAWFCSKLQLKNTLNFKSLNGTVAGEQIAVTKLKNKKMNILNLYAGIGGNRKLWGDNHKITAIEYDKPTADVYQKLFPNDTVIVADAHDYLMKNHQNFDFIWASPPCPTHSRMRLMGVASGRTKPVFPDMKLYQEIIFLQKFANKNTKWVIENVIPYYQPLVEPSIKIDRHFYWSNFDITPYVVDNVPKRGIKEVKSDDIRFGFSVKKSKISNKPKALRNLVNPKIGKHILDCAINAPGSKATQKDPLAPKQVPTKKTEETLPTIMTELKALEGKIVPVSALKKIAIEAGNQGHHEIEQRCLQAIAKVKGNKVKIEAIKPFNEIPNYELSGIADELPETLNGDDDGVYLAGSEYYKELALSLLKHIKSGKTQNISSYVQPKGKQIAKIMVQNGVTKNTYKGMMNRMNLAYHPNPYFATKNNIQQKKGKLKKGAKANWVYFQRVVLKYDKKAVTWNELKKMQKQDSFDAEKYEHYGIFKKYLVYNFAMIEGEYFENKVKEFEKLTQVFEKDFPKPPKRVDAFLKGLPTLNIRKGTNPPAFYAPSKDYIAMPPLSFFASKNRYFQTLFHEMGHWTGHKSRLNRLTDARFGTEPYAKEELVAELAGYFLVNEFKLMENLIKEKAANYLKGWGTAIKVDKAKKLIWAYKKAVEAAEYVLKRDSKGIPLYIQQLNKPKRKTTRKTVKKKATPKKAAPKKVAQLSLLGTSNELEKLGFISAAKTPKQANDVFKLKGPIGNFVQEIQPMQALILIKGTKGTSKTQLAMQLANGFALTSRKVAYIDYEQGGLMCKDTLNSIARNTSKEATSNIMVKGFLENPMKDLHNISQFSDVIIADSVTDLGITADQLNELRKTHQKVIWCFISQVKSNGQMYGGNKMAHNPTAIIECHPTDSFKTRYATLEKNRGNDLAICYDIFKQKCFKFNEAGEREYL